MSFAYDQGQGHKELLKSKFILIVKEKKTKTEAPGVKSGGRPLTLVAKATYAFVNIESHGHPACL